MSDLREACEQLLQGLARRNNTRVYQSDIDDLVCFARQQQVRVWREAAQLSRNEGLAAHLPDDKWDNGYRTAAHNIACGCEAQAAKLEEGSVMGCRGFRYKYGEESH